MNSEMFAEVVPKALSIIAIAVTAFAIWYFRRRLFSRGKNRWSRDVERPQYGSPMPDVYGRIDSSLRHTIDAYGAVREELGKIVENARHSVDEVRQTARDLGAKHDQWTTDFGRLNDYTGKMEYRLDEAVKNLQGDLEEIRLEQLAQINQIEARIEPLFTREVCPWVVAMEGEVALPEDEAKYLEALVAYIEGLNRDLPKYFSGIEAAVSQLGQFVFRSINRKPMKANDAIVEGISTWFSNLHPGHQLKIPVVGDGFDDRYHKDFSSTPRDKDAVSIVAEIVNWGLLEVGSSQRTVFKAEVKCRS